MNTIVWLLQAIREDISHLRSQLTRMEYPIMATQAQVTALTTAVAALVTAQTQVDADLKTDFADVSAEITLALQNAGVNDPAVDAAITSLNSTIADIGTQDAAVQAQNTALAASQAAGGTAPAGGTPVGGNPPASAGGGNAAP